jgi:hypothetical protein
MYGNEQEMRPLRGWKRSALIAPTHRMPARTAVLIIAPPVMGNCFVENRWRIGKKAWEQYMNSHPNVDCYFLQSRDPRPGSQQVWIEGNTIYIGDWWYEKYKSDRILYKTIAAMELLLPNYTHFIRTNLNIFLDLKRVNEYMEMHHQSFYTTPLWEKRWFATGYSMIYTADVALHMVKEYRRLEAAGDKFISPSHPDDYVLTSLATGVWPLQRNHPFRPSLGLPLSVRQLMCAASFATETESQYGVLLNPPISLRLALQRCADAPDTVMLYRTKEGLGLVELAHLYQHLLRKHYPELTSVDLVEYAKSLH